MFRDLRFVEMGRTQSASHMTVRERSMMIDECSLPAVQYSSSAASSSCYKLQYNAEERGASSYYREHFRTACMGIVCNIYVISRGAVSSHSYIT
jgi:hypothetical protein